MNGCQPVVIVQDTINQVVQQVVVPVTTLDTSQVAAQQVAQITQTVALLDKQNVGQVTNSQGTIEVDVPGLPGPPGKDAAGLIPLIDFAYGDAPEAVYTATAAGRITYARASIDTVFDGLGARISIGTLADANSVLPYTYNDPAQLGDYENTPDVQLAMNEQVYIAITPGFAATQGTGFLLLQFIPD